MSKKLSELKDEDILIVGRDLIIPKKYLLDSDYECYKDFYKEDIYTSTEHIIEVDARDMLESALKNKCSAIEEKWLNNILNDIAEYDIDDIQDVVDRILARRYNTYYMKDEKVIIDI